MNKSMSINEELKDWYTKMERENNTVEDLEDNELQDFDDYIEWLINIKSDQYALAFEIKILK